MTTSDANSNTDPTNIAQALVSAFKASGTARMFGLPGGGSSLDLIQAGRDQNVPFILARHECAAAMMAATTAELDGSVGVAIVTKGPGTANAANGVAHASLDRCALAMITDGFTDRIRAFVTHQWYDQKQLFEPITKAHSTLEGATHQQINDLVALTRAPRNGPIHLELTGPAARAELIDSTSQAEQARPQISAPTAPALQAATDLIALSKKPVIVVGLEARDQQCTAAVRQWVAQLGCPALVTYKAKGVIADSDPAFAGIFTGGAAEQPVVNQADLIVLIGVDPVELILQPWPYSLPVLELSLTKHPVHYMTPACLVEGDLTAAVKSLRDQTSDQASQATHQPSWPASLIKQLRQDGIKALSYPPVEQGLSPEDIVRIADRQAQLLPTRPRVAVDAGAHMFSATSFWPCSEPNDLLISNGLASMGFALPAAIAAALHEPGRAAIAFTGDGGLLMCLGELGTAVEQNVPVVVIVFNDGALSLIDVKQQQRELAPDGVRWPRFDFAGVMKSLGGQGYRVRSASGYRSALKRAFAHGGPSLIDVFVDPSGYPAQLRALRG